MDVNHISINKKERERKAQNLKKKKKKKKNETTHRHTKRFLEIFLPTPFNDQASCKVCWGL